MPGSFEVDNLKVRFRGYIDTFLEFLLIRTADCIREQETLRMVVRLLLTMIVYSIKYPLQRLLSVVLSALLASRGIKARNRANKGSIMA